MSSSPSRLASVDALRGLTVAAMLLVNNPGDWGHVLAPLSHAAWHGCTLADLIFPFFLFIVGVSIALSLGAKVESGAPAAPMAQGVLKRAARILVLGLVLHALAWLIMSKPEFRIMGVLQRIGLCFAVAGLAAVYLRARAQWALIAALLLAYGGFLAVSGDLSKAGNWVSGFDAQVLGRFAYEWNAATGLGHEPEGILSTLGALASTLLGLRAGAALRAKQLRNLWLMGAAGLVLGLGLAELQPLNKQLWTPSFVLWTSGWAALALGLAHTLIDQRGLPAIGRAFGVNAIAAYAGAWMCTVLLEGLGLMAPLYTHGFGWFASLVGPFGQSLAFALAFVAVWAGIVRVLDRRLVYFKV